MSPEALSKLAAMPWTYQLVLASGYCSYLLACMGIRRSHKPLDVLFATFAFGLIAIGVLAATEGMQPLLRGASAFASTLAAGIAWRAVFRDGLRCLARKLNYSWNDDSASAWERLIQDRHTPTQLTVELTDGRTLCCSDTRIAGTMPIGPYVFGDAGDVLMYADHSFDANGQRRDTKNLSVDGWGALATYIPASQLRSVSVRHLPVSGPGSGWAARLKAIVKGRRVAD